jgi:ATP-dependent DNA ligase
MVDPTSNSCCSGTSGVYYAFDLLSLAGEDLTRRPLVGRKSRLRQIMPIVESRVLFLDHIERRGVTSSGSPASTTSRQS